jgi:ADP-ribosyltransferase exoenzyme/ADP-Ribosyltransferase in polyvalent proteins
MAVKTASQVHRLTWTPSEIRFITTESASGPDLDSLSDHGGKTVAPLASGVVEKVGPKGYEHGWIKVGPGDVHPDTERTGDEIWQTDEGLSPVSDDDKAKIGKDYYAGLEAQITQNILRHPKEAAAAGLQPGEGIQALKNAISTAKPFQSPVVVHRGVTDARPLFGRTGSHVGKVVTERGFLSTTSSAEHGDQFRGYRMGANSAVIHIHVPAGERALKVTQDILPAAKNSPDAADNMREYTFMPGSQLHVISDEKTGTGKNVHREIHANLVPSRVEDAQKFYLPEIMKVGPEGYIHGYICVRPPCGPVYAEAVHDKSTGRIFHDGSLIAKQLKKQDGDTGYSIAHTEADGSKTKLTGFATRGDAAVAAIAYHNVGILHEQQPSGAAKIALGDAKARLAAGDKAGAARSLRDASAAAKAAGDESLASHAEHIWAGLTGEEPVEPKPAAPAAPVIKPESAISPEPLNSYPDGWSQEAADWNFAARSARAASAHAAAIQRESLPADEKAAVNRYLGAGYQAVNPALRSGTSTADSRLIDGAMSHGKLQSEITTYRAIDQSTANAIFGNNWQNHDLTGVSHIDPAFASTSASGSVTTRKGFGDSYAGAGDAGVYMRLHVQPGVSAVSVTPESANESEILLDRNLTYTVTHDHGVAADGIRELDVSVSKKEAVPSPPPASPLPSPKTPLASPGSPESSSSSPPAPETRAPAAPPVTTPAEATAPRTGNELWASHEGEASLSDEQKKAIARIWYSPQYMATNMALRNPDKAWLHSPQLDADTATFKDAVSRSTPFTTNATVYRAISNSDKIFGAEAMKPGTVFSDKGFISVTADKKFTEDFTVGLALNKNAVITITMPPGTKALKSDTSVLHLAKEKPTDASEVKEYTLPPDTKFRVTRDEIISGKDAYGSPTYLRHVSMEVVPEAEPAPAVAASNWKPAMSEDDAVKWAENSAVPQEMYHGTPDAARADSIAQHGFDESKLGDNSGNRGWAGEGAYLTERPESAASYGIAGDSGTVLSARVNASSPWDSSMLHRTSEDVWSYQKQYRAAHPDASQDDVSRAIRAEAERRGHDSIIQRGSDGKINEMVVFSPHQVTITGSRPAMDVALAAHHTAQAPVQVLTAKNLEKTRW